jgi:hypothetical protein
MPITGYSNTISVTTLAPSLLLDLYPSAAAAYSVRKLRTAYTGSAIRVRRSSDNTEQNIGFVNNVLDTSTLTSFCSGTNGFVTTWYDQSGNGRDATQTTASNQPQIVSSGSVITLNGKPSMKFDGSNDILSNNTSIFSGAGSRSIATVYKPNNDSGTFAYSIFGTAGSQNNGYWTMIQSRTQFVTGDPYFAGYGADLGDGLSIPNTSQKLGQFYYNGAIGYLYKNNVLLTSASLTLNAQNNQIYVGGSSSTVECANADIQECIAWASNQQSNVSGISININSFYGIY